MTANGKIDFRLRSDTLPMKELAASVPLRIAATQVRGEPVINARGRLIRQAAAQNGVSFDAGEVGNADEANAVLERALAAIANSRIRAGLVRGEATGQTIVAAFDGSVDWESGLSPQCIAAAKALNREFWIEHYDRFTDGGVPLSIRL